MPHYFEFELSLLHIEPRIWRRFLLAAEDATFLDLHHAIQEADTWTDMHLWQFREAGRRGEAIAAMPEDEEMGFDGLENNGPPAEDVSVRNMVLRWPAGLSGSRGRHSTATGTLNPLRMRKSPGIPANYPRKSNTTC
jgi:hypothetical protein